MKPEHLISIDSQDLTPIYAQIFRQVARLIDMGAWNVGDRVPSVRALAISLRINPTTVHSAYRQLQESGHIEARKGHGVFVRSTKIKDHKAKFASELKEVMKRWLASGLSRDEMKKISATIADNI